MFLRQNMIGFNTYISSHQNIYYKQKHYLTQMELEKIQQLQISVNSKIYNGQNIVNLCIKAPEAPPKRDPVAIICVLDISGSMDCQATQAGAESDGFTRLDLVKHSVNTIINALDTEDALGIVTFSNYARIDFKMGKMTESGRKNAMKVVSDMKTQGATNLWDGMRTGLQLSKDQLCLTRNTFVVVLSDGEPNQHPPSGQWGAAMEYIQQNPLRCSMSMFGYGYSLDTNLLGALTELGGGCFGYIPDCSMIGTIFVNFLSTALSTFSPKISLLVDSDEGRLLQINGVKQHAVNLGGIQYGMTRNCLLRYKSQNQNEVLSNLNIQLGSELRASKSIKIQNCEVGSAQLIQIQQFRYEHIRLLIKSIQDADKNLKSCLQQFKKHCDMMEEFYAKNGSSNQFIDGLIRDIKSESEREGQISIALSKDEFWQKWGLHYFHALKIANLVEMCTNFKDPGIQAYGGNLFKTLQDSIDTIFIKLPPPQPSISKYDAHGNLKQVDNMDDYYDAYGGCIHGECLTQMASGLKTKVSHIKKGDVVLSSKGPAKILCVVKTKVDDVIKMISFPGGLSITSYHPIIYNGEWKFPIEVGTQEYIYTDAFYNFVIEGGHSMVVNGMECITLGHGIKGDKVAEHEYFGTERIIEDLKKMQGWDDGLVCLQQLAFKRNKETKLVEGINLEAVLCE